MYLKLSPLKIADKEKETERKKEKESILLKL